MCVNCLHLQIGNPSEPRKNDKFPKKTYTFDVTKYDEIFNLLVVDGQVLVPSGAKVLPLEQRKKQGFCKYHNFLGHKTSQCFLFRDLVQNALNDGRLKFAKGKTPMNIDSDPLQVREANVVEPVGINMDTITDFDMEARDEAFESNEIEAFYPKAGEGLLEFLHQCKDEDSEVMMCPRCSAIFDKRVAKKVESVEQAKRKENWRRRKPGLYFDKRVVPKKKEQFPNHQRGKPHTYMPTLNAPQGSSLEIRDGGMSKRFETLQ